MSVRTTSSTRLVTSCRNESESLIHQLICFAIFCNSTSKMGHCQSMQHFDNGVAFDWKIEDEYPSGDGVYTPDLPWGYDSVLRQFRTWFDPLDGTGKKDPLNGEGKFMVCYYILEMHCFAGVQSDPLNHCSHPLHGEGEPPYSQDLNCFSQYTPYQAQVSQEW